MLRRIPGRRPEPRGRAVVVDRFRRYVRMGDLDGDGVAEVVAGFRWSRLAVYDTTTRSVRYELPVFNLDAVHPVDVEGDGPLGLVYGDAQWGAVHVLNGASGVETWSDENPELGITDISVGDVDSDGAPELVHTSFRSDAAYDDGVYFVHDAASKTRQRRVRKQRKAAAKKKAVR